MLLPVSDSCHAVVGFKRFVEGCPIAVSRLGRDSADRQGGRFQQMLSDLKLYIRSCKPEALAVQQFEFVGESACT
jgi:hypothetical protein